MSDVMDFETRLTRALERYAERSPIVVDPYAITAAVASRASRGASREGFVRTHWLPRRLALVVLVALIALVATATAIVGSGILVWPSIAPPISIAPTTSPLAVATSPSPSSSASQPHRGVIAFIRYVVGPADGASSRNTVERSRLFIVDSGGGGLRELLPGPGNKTSVAWSPDGTRLVFAEGGKLFLTDAAGSDPQLVNTSCNSTCLGDGDAAFSSDGSRLVFKRQLDGGSSAIATMEIASHRVSDLSSTTGAGDERPQWSPDGQHIAFSRYDKGPSPAVFIVDADGQNLRQLSPATLPSRYPDWSADGTRVVFTSFADQIVGTLGKDATSHLHRDIYSVRADGSDLRRLTTEGISSGAAWTADGRLVFSRIPLDSGNMPITDASALWTMDADGSNAALLLKLLGEYNDTYGGIEAAWQPIP